MRQADFRSSRLRIHQRPNHRRQQEQARQEGGVSVADVDVEAGRDRLHVGVVEAGVVYPDVRPERRAEYLAKAHPSEDYYRDRPRLTKQG